MNGEDLQEARMEREHHKRETTRRKIITAGLERIASDGVPLFELPKLRDCVRDVDLSLGAGYHIWGNQRGFRADLLDALADWSEYVGDDPHGFLTRADQAAGLLEVG